MPTQAAYDKVFLNIAKEISGLSKCVSHQVGAVIVRDGRILSTGYNGSPPGFKNCDEVFDKPADVSTWEHREAHHTWSNRHEAHAEINAICWAAKNGIAVDNSTLYCTLEPCDQCVKYLTMVGIKRVVYAKKYDKVSADENDLRKIIDCVHLV